MNQGVSVGRERRGASRGAPRGARGGEATRRSDERDHAEMSEARGDRTSPLVGVEIFLLFREALRGAKSRRNILFRRLFLLNITINAPSRCARCTPTSLMRGLSLWLPLKEGGAEA